MKPVISWFECIAFAVYFYIIKFTQLTYFKSQQEVSLQLPALSFFTCTYILSVAVSENET